MQSDVGDSLPDTIETIPHNGIDPSVILRSGEDDPDLMDNGLSYDGHKGNGGG